MIVVDSQNKTLDIQITYLINKQKPDLNVEAGNAGHGICAIFCGLVMEF